MKTEICLARLEVLCTEYCKTADTLEHSRKPFAGMLGLPGGPSEDPCHARFCEDAQALLRAFAADAPDSAGVRAVLARIYAAPQELAPPKTAFWTLIAVQGLTRELIGRLSNADAEALAADYGKRYPRRARLPVQDEILKCLQTRARSH